MAISNRASAADVQVGVVCGVGAAVAAWTIAGDKNVLGAECLAFVALGTLTATAWLRGSIGWLHPVARSVAVATTLFLFGVGPALLVAEIVTASTLLGQRASRGPLFLLGVLHAFALAAIGTLVPGIAYLGLDGTAPIDLASVTLGALLGFVVASVATQQALSRFAGRLPGDAGGPAQAAVSWRDLGRESAAVLTAALIAAAYQIPDLRGWLALLPIGSLLLLARPDSGSRTTSRSPTVSAEAHRAIAEGLASASALRGRGDRAHLQRVEDWAVEIAEDLGFSEGDLDSMGTAALLHEIGVLALPEELATTALARGSIEPHPALAGEILDALTLPAAVRAFVRHQTERWDGSGRPSGLAGDAIPLGARILAVADAFDDWTFAGGPRPLRDAGLARLRAEAGTRFDPRVVEAATRRLRSGARAWRSGSAGPVAPQTLEPSTRLRDSARELHTLYEIERSVGYRLDPRENLLLVLGKLGSLVPHDTAAVYLLEDGEPALRARFALGGAASLVEGLALASDRMSARAAIERRTVSGGPAGEFDLHEIRRDPRVAGLVTGLAAPIFDGERVRGALTIYAGPEREFDADDRRVLVSVASHVAAALRRSEPGDPAYLESLTDPGTGLPNARYLEICGADAAVCGAPGPARYGLLAFRWLDFDTICERNGVTEATRTMGVLGRRLAAVSLPREVPVRYGTDVFAVLVPACEPSALVGRWNALLHAAETTPIELPHGGGTMRVRLASAQSFAPVDGGTLEALLVVLGSRIGPADPRGARVVPFRVARTAG